MNKEIQFRFIGNPLLGVVDLYVLGDGVRGELVLNPCDEAAAQDKTSSVDRKQAIQIMNDLWDAGIRPTDLPEKVRHITGSNDKHLQDMRLIASKFLKIDLDA